MHVLGVDGAGGLTRACVLDFEGRVVGLSRGPGTGDARIGFRHAKRIWGHVAYLAVVDAGLDTKVEAACWALAGRNASDGSAHLHRLVTRLGLAGRNLVQTDAEAVMSAGLPRGWGVGAVCDDGLRIAARTPDGHTQSRSGPSTPAAGEWGDAQAIGREALRLALRSSRGLELPSLLADRAPSALGAASFAQMSRRHLARSVRLPGWEVPLALVLFDCAREGDKLAGDLARRIGTDIGTAVADLIHRLSMETLGVDIALGGRLLEAAPPPLIDSIAAAVRPTAPAARLIPAEFPPVIGAALGALREAGIEVDERVRAHLRATYFPDSPWQ